MGRSFPSTSEGTWTLRAAAWGPPALCCLLVVGLPLWAQDGGRAQVANAPPQQAPRTDYHGDPLPPGAVARLGTVRWNHPLANWLRYAADGKTLYSAGSDLRQWDAATGRELGRWSFPELPLPFCSPLGPLDAERKVLVSYVYGGSTIVLWDLAA